MKKIVFGLIALVIISAGSVFAQNKFPGWAKGIVWYQIFPERFADGDTANEPFNGRPGEKLEGVHCQAYLEQR